MSLKIRVLTQKDDLTLALEFRATIMSQSFGIANEEDKDQWDQTAYHIVATSKKKVVGYYRAIVKNDLGFYTESEFDIFNLKLKRSKVLEIGRAAVHPDYRNPAIIPMLWGKIFELANKLGCKWIIGAASLTPTETNVIAARDAWRVKYKYLEGAHAVPLNPYTEESATDGAVPKLLQVYEKLGARIVSDPSWDPVFRTADVVTLIDLREINQRWLERLL